VVVDVWVWAVVVMGGSGDGWLWVVVINDDAAGGDNDGVGV
jgi:hypothetical protein